MFRGLARPWNITVSYIDRDTDTQRYVPLPENRGGVMIAGDPMPPGSVHTIGRAPVVTR